MTNEERFARLEEIAIGHQERISYSEERIRQNEERIRQNEIEIAEIKALNKQVALTLQMFVEHVQTIEDRLDGLQKGQEDLAAGQAHTDTRLDALIDIVQQKFN